MNTFRTVAIAFGHGLSYAHFEYSDLTIEPSAGGYDVSCLLTNVSDVDAEEVVQVYVSRPESVIERPEKELKGFLRVALPAGTSQRVSIPLRRADLCHWDPAAHAWMLEPGRLVVQVGGCSAQLPLRAMTEL